MQKWGFMSDLYDIHQELFRSSFEKALPFDPYISTGTEDQQRRFRDMRKQLTVSQKQEEVISQFKRRLHVLVISGTWCGDCVRQCPMIACIGDAAPTVDVRFLDNQENPELAKELRVHGASRVPVAVFLSEDFFEVSRFGDRTLSHYRRKAEREAGVACDAGLLPPSGHELEEELLEWFEQFERAQLLLRTSGLLRARYGD